MVDEVHAAGRKLFTWTVNQRRDLVRLANWGVDGLISDDPKLLRQIFETGKASETVVRQPSVIT